MVASKKAGSSSESSGSSSDSEAEVTGLIPKLQKKKSQLVKDGKKSHPHVHSGPPGLISQAPGLQATIHMKPQPPQQAPAPGFMAGPVAALESSQMLENSFDPLPHFGQPLMHLPHHAGNAASPAAPQHNAHPAAGPASPETHPFLNQHPALTPAGETPCTFTPPGRPVSLTCAQ